MQELSQNHRCLFSTVNVCVVTVDLNTTKYSEGICVVTTCLGQSLDELVDQPDLLLG